MYTFKGSDIIRQADGEFSTWLSVRSAALDILDQMVRDSICEVTIARAGLKDARGRGGDVPSAWRVYRLALSEFDRATLARERLRLVKSAAEYFGDGDFAPPFAVPSATLKAYGRQIPDLTLHRD